MSTSYKYIAFCQSDDVTIEGTRGIIINKLCAGLYDNEGQFVIVDFLFEKHHVEQTAYQTLQAYTHNNYAEQNQTIMHKITSKPVQQQTVPLTRS